MGKSKRKGSVSEGLLMGIGQSLGDSLLTVGFSVSVCRNVLIKLVNES